MFGSLVIFKLNLFYIFQEVFYGLKRVGLCKTYICFVIISHFNVILNAQIPLFVGRKINYRW